MIGVPAVIGAVLAGLTSIGWGVGQIRMGVAVTYALALPGTAGNYASAGDSSGNSITGDIDVRAQVALSDWDTSIEYIAAKYLASGDQRSWNFIIINGVLFTNLSTNGITATSASSGASVGVADNTLLWVRFTWRQSDGRIQFFTSADGVSWAQLGTNQTISIPAIYDSIADVEIGSALGGTSFPLAGNVYKFELRAGIGGTVVNAFDATAVTRIGTRNPSIVSAGGPWTIHGTAWDWTPI